jgi:queuine/archaeosine tRNA-ribosyltransferase
MFNQVFLTKEDGGLEILEFNHRTGKNEFLERVRGRECECPVCRGRISEDLLVSGKRKYYSLRSLHNYWHLKRAIEG